MTEAGKIAVDIVRKAQRHLSLHGKHAVVVGGTSGIGHAMAVRLAQANANVQIVGRNKQAGLAIVEEMKRASTSIPEIVAKTPSSFQPPKFGFIECDASLLRNVKQTSQHIKDLIPKVDYLICSQGIATVAGRTETSEGIEQKLALHYYSRYAFPLHLRSHLQKSVDPRYISVLSGGVHNIYKSFKEDPDLVKNFSLINMANATGMYNDFACDALSQRYPDISFIHIAPGTIATNWGKEMPWYIKPILNVAKKYFRTKEDCAEYLCQTIFKPDFKAPGSYILNQYASPAKITELHTRENVDLIWKHTESVINKF